MQKKLKLFYSGKLYEYQEAITKVLKKDFPEIEWSYVDGSEDIATTAAHNDPDIILVHAEHPVKNLFEMCTKIKSASPLDSIPLIVIFDKPNESLSKQAVAAGVDAIVSTKTASYELPFIFHKFYFLMHADNGVDAVETVQKTPTISLC
ncbi:MAG TPA: hypothetical protein VKA27_16355 [Sunxiuqinia sp.]|nr:hypothetical protein [Sunxiuqinia sp.]